VINGDNHSEEVVKSPSECEPSWSLGCLYRCAICGVKFQTLTSFQSHLFFHRITPEQYLAQHGDPGVQFQHHACLRCGEMVQQDPLHLRLHLLSHGLNLAQYTNLLEAEGSRGSSSGEGEVVSSASSTSKSSPGVQARQSVDNMSESQGSSKEGEKEVGDLEEDVDEELEDGEMSVKAEPITTEPDIELSYFSPSHESDFPVFPGSQDLEGEVSQNIIRDLTKSAETFFHQQQQQAARFQQQRSFHSQYFPGFPMHGAPARTQYSAGRIAWYHGCLFQCSIESCNRQFFEKVFLKAHVESQHRGINFDQYMLDFGNANTVIHHHECELCGMGVLHTARNIENHLMTQHGVSMAQYYEEFKHSIKIVNLEITDESLFQVDAASIMLEKQFRFPSQLLAEGHQGHHLQMRSPSVDWADRCLYECKECRPSETFDTHSKVSYHVKKRHLMAMKDYTTRHGRAMVYEEKHTCQVCGSHVLWERSSIYQHIYQVHNRMTMEEYGRLMVNYKDAPAEQQQKQTRQMSYVESNIDWTNECIFECKLCQPSRKFNSKNKISFHVKRMHGLKMTEYNKKYGSSLLYRSWHTCQICGISILCDYFSLYQHITKGHKVTLNDYQEQLMSGFETEKIEWLNRCVFGCKICNQDFQFRSDFINHIEAEHGISQNLYRKDKGNIYKHKEIHICQIKSCGKRFVWDTLSLRAHIEKKHEMQCDEYYGRFMTNYAEKSPSLDCDRKGDRGIETVDSKINQCEYQCQLCDEFYRVDRYYSDHLKNVHNINKNDYKGCFGLGVTRKVAQNCQLCKANPKEFLMDQAYLGVHIRITHKQSINAYIQKLDDIPTMEDDIREDEEWCYQCRYICCDTIFRQKWKFDRHISSCHGMLVSEFYEQNNILRASPGYYLRKTYHSCRICNKEILCDKGPLQSHIRTHDSMSLESYHTDYILTNKRMDTNWMEKAIHSNVIHTCQICHTNVAWNKDDLTAHLKSHDYTSEKYKAEFMATYRFNNEATMHMTDDSNWSDQNRFECKVEGCNEKLTSRVRLVLHIQKVHTLTALEYFREHKDSLTTDKYHKCQLCCAKILWDSYYLRDHLRVKHKMKLITYKNKFISSYNDNITAEEAKAIAKKKVGGEKPKKKKKKEERSDEITEDEAEVWATASLFCCQLCDPPLAMQGKEKFSRHLVEEHETPYRQYAKQCQDYKLVSSCHTCKICQTNVKWDIGPLTLHFEDVHKMPLKDYYNKHKPKMPKLSKGATNKASKEETDDAADDDDEEIPKKAVETGDD